MRNIIILIALFSISSCQLSEGNRKSSNKIDFEKYLNSLDTIPLPLEYNPLGKLPELSKNYDPALFKKYKHTWASKPLGIYSLENEMAVLIDLSIGDAGLVPFLVCYDLEGNKIDSTGFFKKSGWDLAYEAIEYITFKKNNIIMVTDTVKRWKIIEGTNNYYPDSLTITCDTVYYSINKEGIIEKK